MGVRTRRRWRARDNERRSSRNIGGGICGSCFGRADVAGVAFFGLTTSAAAIAASLLSGLLVGVEGGNNRYGADRSGG